MLRAAQLPNRTCRNQALQEYFKDTSFSSQHSPDTSLPPSLWNCKFLPLKGFIFNFTKKIKKTKNQKKPPNNKKFTHLHSRTKYKLCLEIYTNSSHQFATEVLLDLVLRIQTLHHFLNNYNSVLSTCDTQKKVTQVSK